jgi:heme iron utilization protein
MERKVDIEKKKEQYIQFLKTRKTLVISMLDEKGNPFTSYAPFVQYDGKFYIYISKISEHYAFMEANNIINIMMIADEQASPNLFARERIRFSCTAMNVGNKGYDEVFAKFEENHGAAMMGVLRSLDLSLFELTPGEGRYVVGFGQAFEIDASGEKFEHVTGDKKEK